MWNMWTRGKKYYLYRRYSGLTFLLHCCIKYVSDFICDCVKELFILFLLFFCINLLVTWPKLPVCLSCRTEHDDVQCERDAIYIGIKDYITNMSVCLSVFTAAQHGGICVELSRVCKNKQTQVNNQLSLNTTLSNTYKPSVNFGLKNE